MKNYIFKDSNGSQYKRIDKRTARRLYNENKAVIICPCNLRPFSFWHVETELQKSNLSDFVINGIPENDFNRVVLHFEYYNCTDNETGYKSAFYTALEN